jgi:hypothetical protein
LLNFPLGIPFISTPPSTLFYLTLVSIKSILPHAIIFVVHAVLAAYFGYYLFKK